MDDHDLLVRIDERVEAVRDDIEAIQVALKTRYVTQDEFHPIKQLVYGAVGFILITVTTLLLRFFVTG